MEVLTTFLTCIIIVLTVSYLFFRRKSRNPPPGPKGYPMIGNSLSINAKYLHMSLTELAETYGDIFEINLFGQTVVVLNSHQLIREAFLKEPNATLFSNRIQGSLVREIYFGAVDIVFSNYNKDWVKRRKLAHKILNAYGDGMKSIEANVQKLLSLTVEDLKKHAHKCFDPEPIIDSFLAQLIAILMTGRWHDLDSDFLKGMTMHDNTLNRVLAPDVMLIIDWLPFMRYVPGPVSRAYSNFKKYQRKFYQLIKQEYELGNTSGMIHELYLELNKMKETDTSKWLSENSVNTMVTNLVAGGILTSKGTIWSGISILLHRRDIQVKLQEEVDRVVGSDRQPSLSDREYMPYTDAFLLEVLRTISHLPLLVPHCVAADTQLAGYDIKKGSMIFPNIWKIHHDGAIFHDPYKFDPERFLDKDENLLHTDHPLRQSLLTFSVGKRSCIGEAFAKNRLFLFFSTLMQSFTFLPDESGKSTKFDPRDMEVFIVNMPKRFKCRIVERIKH